MDDASLRQNRRQAPAAPHVATLLVSVFLVLLAFFVALSSHSDYDPDRSGAVMNSVSKTFSSTPQNREGKLPSEVLKPAIEPVTIDAFFEDVKVSVATLVPLHEVQTTTQGNSLKMEMPSINLFTRGSDKLRQDRSDFYSLLTGIVSRWQDNADVSVSLVQGIPAGDAEEAKLAVTRGGNFARFLENQGVPPEHIGIAISHTHPDKIVLYFDVSPLADDAVEGER